MSGTGLADLLKAVPQGGTPAFLTIQESAAWVGRITYLEAGVFERLGRRAALLEPAPVALWAEGASLAAAWRASLLEELLPVSVGLPRGAELTRSAGEAVEVALDRLGPPAGGTDPEPDGSALVSYVSRSLYPALLEAYETRGASCSEAADGPLLRVLARVTADLRAELKSAIDVAENACRPA